MFQNKLDIRQTPEGNVVTGLIEIPVKDKDQVRGEERRGEERRREEDTGKGREGVRRREE